MDPLLIGILGMVALVALIVAGIHIAISLALVGFVGLWFVLGFEPAVSMMLSGMYHKVASYDLMAVPVFVLMGLLAAGGGVSAALYDGLSMWVGKIRGGLGIATTIASAAFGTICGSAVVTATVFSKISSPEMRRHGYDKRIAYGISASSGAIGMLIPPSVLMIVYGGLSGDSIGKLLIAGTSPGIILSLTICGAIVLITKIRPDWIPPVSTQGVTWRKRFAALKSFWPIAIIATVVFGGIFGGAFSPTEAGAIATFIMCVIFFAIKRRKSLEIFKTSLFDMAGISAMILFIFGGATVFTHFLVMTGISGWIVNGLIGLNVSNLSLIILIALMYIGLGCFLDGISMICITIPIFAPAINALGIDSIWFAMVVILAMHVGLITPPVGLDVYAAKGVAEPDVSIEDIFAGSFPFFFATLVALVIIIAFPWLSTILPRLMMG